MDLACVEVVVGRDREGERERDMRERERERKKKKRERESIILSVIKIHTECAFRIE